MRVRVHDKDRGIFFKSDVYAKINKGYFEKYLVLMPKSEGGCLKLYDYLDKSEKDGSLSVNINMINSERPDEWVEFDDINLPSHEEMQIEKFDYFLGYDSIWENKNALAVLLRGLEVHPRQFNLKPVKCMYGDDWNFINTEKDVKLLMDTCKNFHDAVIVSMNYISGSCKCDGGIIVEDNIRRVSIIFDSCWCNSLELVFEGVLSLNIRPATDNCTSYIYTASVIIKDEIIYFAADEIADTTNISEDITWISAFSLKWR